MAARKAPAAAKMGRPRKSASDSLQAYGLHLSRESIAKLMRVKEAQGKSVRDYIEQKIAYDFDVLFNGREPESELRAIIEEQRVTIAKLSEKYARVLTEGKLLRAKLVRATRRVVRPSAIRR